MNEEKSRKEKRAVGKVSEIFKSSSCTMSLAGFRLSFLPFVFFSSSSLSPEILCNQIQVRV